MKDKLNGLLSRYMNRETITYLIFGVLTTLVNWAVYYGLRAVEVDFRISNWIAWLIAVIFAYFTNKKYVFQSLDYSLPVLGREFAVFAGGRVFSGVVEYVFMLITVQALKLPDRLMKIAVSVIVVILNYILSKLFVFRNHKE